MILKKENLIKFMQEYMTVIFLLFLSMISKRKMMMKLIVLIKLIVIVLIRLIVIVLIKLIVIVLMIVMEKITPSI